MRSHLRLAAVCVLTAVLIVPGAASASARADVFVEVNPSTVAAGGTVRIRASCPQNTADATVRSDAFGEVTVKPEYGFLTGSGEIAADLAANEYRVELVCPAGDGAVDTLRVIADTRPSQGPATGLGGLAGRDPDAGAFALLGGGLTALAAGAVLALVWLRRRRLSG